MASKIPSEFIDELLLRVDIVDLIDAHVPLKKSGGSFKARCPFHAEKSPSFFVKRDKQFYHCFGCGAGGNAISFLMAFSHLDFIEAIEDLAGFIGVDVPKEVQQHQPIKQDLSALYLVLKQAAVFYVEQLRRPQGAKAIKYLKSRGFSGEIAKEFSLGYASNDWDVLSSQFDVELLIDAGMVVNKEKGQHYDRFRGRLVFPIRDRRGRVVGFGGRVLDASLPKYLNSPETAVFLKGKELYGLFELLKKQSKPKRIIVVEGYMDVLALAQFGIHYSVAVLGTAISKNHLDLLFRFTSELVFCFDGDSAGQQATWRAVQESLPCLKDGRQVKIMLLAEGHDPDTLVRQGGVDSFERHWLNAQVLSDYFIETLSRDLNLETIEGRTQLIVAAKPQIEKIPVGFFREMMGDRLKALSAGPALDVLENTTTLDVINRQSTMRLGNMSRAKTLPSLTRIVIALLLQNPRLIDVVKQFEINWQDFDFLGKEVLLELIMVIGENKAKTSAIVVEYFRDGLNEKVVNALVKWNFIIPEKGLEAEFSDAFKNMLLQANEKSDKKRVDQLVDKEKTAGLSVDEKEQLLRLLSKK